MRKRLFVGLMLLVGIGWLEFTDFIFNYSKYVVQNRNVPSFFIL